MVHFEKIPNDQVLLLLRQPQNEPPLMSTFTGDNATKHQFTPSAHASCYPRSVVWRQ